jgi:hypothetical protein
MMLPAAWNAGAGLLWGVSDTSDSDRLRLVVYFKNPAALARGRFTPHFPTSAAIAFGTAIYGDPATANADHPRSLIGLDPKQPGFVIINMKTKVIEELWQTRRDTWRRLRAKLLLEV